MAIPKQTVVEEELDDKAKRDGKKSANAGSSDRSNKASRTAFPRPIRSMSPSRPPPAAIRRENNEPPAKDRRAPRPWRPLSIAAETARFF